MKMLFMLKENVTELVLKLLCSITLVLQEIFIHLLIILILMKVEHMKLGSRAALTRIINSYAKKQTY